MLDIFEYFSLIDGTIKLTKDLMAFVVAVVREIIIFVAELIGIAIIRIFEGYSVLFLDLHVWAWGFEVGAPRIVFWHLR